MPTPVIIELLGNGGDPVRYTVGVSGAITKGNLWRLVDPRTASGAGFANTRNACAGVSAFDKSATDSAISHTFYTNCLIDAACSGAGTAGQPITFIMDDYVTVPDGLASGAQIAGYLTETATNAEVVVCRIKL